MNLTSNINTKKYYKKYNQIERRKKDSTCEKAKRERERDCEKKARIRLNESKSTAQELMVAVKCARRRYVFTNVPKNVRNATECMSTLKSVGTNVFEHNSFVLLCLRRDGYKMKSTHTWILDHNTVHIVHFIITDFPFTWSIDDGQRNH